MTRAIAWSPSLNDTIVGRRLAGILRPGELREPDLESRLRRIGDLFEIFVRWSAPGPGRGAVITPELRGEWAKYLPPDQIAAAFSRLLRRSFFPPFLPGRLPPAESWFELLEAFPPPRHSDPAWWLRRLADDFRFRTEFLFHTALPRRHGEAFLRYPGQLAFLRNRLRERGTDRPIACLDAACGTGEGTWEVAALLLAEGMAPPHFSVRGETLGLLECFAAVHGFFPHDQRRQEEYRRNVAPLVDAGAAARITFAVADLLTPSEEDGGFDIVLCNGILGGPFLHDDQRLRTAIRALASRLAPGGLLVASDTFHAGWKQKVPPERIAELIREAGLETVPAPEGIAAVTRQYHGESGWK